MSKVCLDMTNTSIYINMVESIAEDDKSVPVYAKSIPGDANDLLRHSQCLHRSGKMIEVGKFFLHYSFFGHVQCWVCAENE
jgi:hypothetical protein